MARGFTAPAPKATSSKPASSSKKKEKELEIPQRNLLQEGRDAIQVMREAYPALYDIQNQYNPQFAELEARTGATRSKAETAGVVASGTSIRDAIRGASPEIAASGDALLAGLKGVGPSAIETQLNNQALSELKMGGDLSPDEIRQVQQGSRAAASSRGLANTSGSAIAEVMSRAGAAEARKAGRRNFAAGVDVNTQQRKASDNSYVLNAGQAAMRDYDPYQRIYGNGGSQATGQVSGPGQFGNYLNAAGSVGAGNQSALLAGAQLQQDQNQFEINRVDSRYYSEQNLANGNANAAASRKNATTNAAIGAGAGIASAALLAFLI